MKKLLFLTAFCCVVSAASAQEPQAIGSIRYSEELGAYEIKSTDNLNDLAVYVNGIGTYSTGESEHENHTCMGQSFKMTADIAYGYTTKWDNINAQESNFVVIGNGSQKFCGTFDGDGHTISGIRIYTSNRRQGLFSLIDNNAKVCGIILTDTRISSYIRSGGIVGEIKQGYVEDCHVTSTVSICAKNNNSSYFGGIAGIVSNGSVVTHCTSSATLVANDNSRCFGAIAGVNYGTISDNLAIGATIPAVLDNKQGAIVGANEGTLERNYYAACTVADVANATGVGCNNADEIGTTDHPDAAVPALRSNAENSTAIALLADYDASLTGHNGLEGYNLSPAAAPISVQLIGHTFYKDGKWNTLCLPFDVNDFSGTPLDGAKVMELGNSDACDTGFDASTGTLHLHFVESNKVEAGHAYIMRWNNGTNITDPVFVGVTIKNENPENQKVVSRDGRIAFSGTYVPISYSTENRSILLMGSNGTNSTLFYPKSGVFLSAFRCHFVLDGITVGDNDSNARAFVLTFDNNDESDILGITDLSLSSDRGHSSVGRGSVWYDLRGRKLNTSSRSKGIYIKDGKKYVVK